MCIDGNKWGFENSNKNKTSKAYVLERSGPDCITPDLELRIPEGRYSVAWHTSSENYKSNVLKLYNDYLSQDRAILIHSGENPQNSRGCLLLEEKIGGKNQLERGVSIIKALQNTFNDKNFKQTFGNMPNATNHIMVVVKNEFDKAEQANQSQATIYALNKQKGEIYPIKFNSNDIEIGLLDLIKQDSINNIVRILKSWSDTNQIIKKKDCRKIALSTIDIINRKDMSKNPLIYVALDKLIADYKIYKDNFPKDYYVEFGRYMLENANFENDLMKTFKNLRYFMYSKENGASKEGGIAIFHLYESYVPKYDNDENGTDKVLHFLESARLVYSTGEARSVKDIGILNEIKDMFFGDGFSYADIVANQKGIDYGIELRQKEGKGYCDNEYIPL